MVLGLPHSTFPFKLAAVIGAWNKYSASVLLYCHGFGLATQHLSHCIATVLVAWNQFLASVEAGIKAVNLCFQGLTSTQPCLVDFSWVWASHTAPFRV